MWLQHDGRDKLLSGKRVRLTCVCATSDVVHVVEEGECRWNSYRRVSQRVEMYRVMIHLNFLGEI